VDYLSILAGISMFMANGAGPVPCPVLSLPDEFSITRGSDQLELRAGRNLIASFQRKQIGVFPRYHLVSADKKLVAILQDRGALPRIFNVLDCKENLIGSIHRDGVSGYKVFNAKSDWVGAANRDRLTETTYEIKKVVSKKEGDILLNFKSGDRRYWQGKVGTRDGIDSRVSIMFPVIEAILQDEDPFDF
jgi:hypothetical protein